MSLIKCTECEKEVSDQATSCPNCGAPINTDAQKKFCKHCGEKIDKDCIICPKCGKQVEQLNDSSKNIVINNNNNNNSSASSSSSASATVYATPSRGYYGTSKNKWVAFFLCLFFGYFGVHKFYEGKTGKGILYLFTFGLLGIGWIVDTISLFFKPNPYYV